MKLTFAGDPVNLVGQQAKVGDMAPEFKATKNDMSEFDSKSTLGKVTIYSVVPSLDTGVCSIQTTTFNEDIKEFEGDVELITISLDLPFAQERFCANKGIDNSITVSDYKDREFGEKYGFLVDELKLLARGVVVLDRQGKIAYVEYVPEITNEVNFDKALEVVKELI